MTTSTQTLWPNLLNSLILEQGGRPAATLWLQGFRGLTEGNAGPQQCPSDKIADPGLVELAHKVRFEIDLAPVWRGSKGAAASER